MSLAHLCNFANLLCRAAEDGARLLEKRPCRAPDLLKLALCDVVAIEQLPVKVFDVDFYNMLFNKEGVRIAYLPEFVPAS